MTQILHHKTTGDEYPLDECTPLVPHKDYDVRGTILYAYMTPDGVIDSDEVEEITIYTIRGKHYDCPAEATEALRAEFRSLFDPGVRPLGEDTIADNEDFANWTDSLCKDGEICDDLYREGGAFHDN